MSVCLTLAPRLALAQTEPARERPREGDLLVLIGAAAPEPLTPDNVPLGGKQIMAWPMETVQSVGKAALEGVISACREAEVQIIGGHTIRNDQPVLGLCVTGDDPDLRAPGR